MLPEAPLRIPILLLLWSLFAAFMLPLSGGCYNYKPLTVTVLDASSVQPIAGATLQSDYDVGLFHVAPRRARATTGGDGKANISVADDINGVTITATAVGYEENSMNLSLYAPGVDPYAGTPEWKERNWPYLPVTILLKR